MTAGIQAKIVPKILRSTTTETIAKPRAQGAKGPKHFSLATARLLEDQLGSPLLDSPHCLDHCQIVVHQQGKNHLV